MASLKRSFQPILAEKRFGPEKFPVYLYILRTGNVSTLFETAISSCFSAMKSRLVYSKKVKGFEGKQPRRLFCKKQNAQINCNPAVGQHLL